jgi:ferredoxin
MSRPFSAAARGEQAVRIEVNHDLCEGNGVCESIAPAVFDLTDEGLHLTASALAGVDRFILGRAVASCPQQALSIVEE